MSIFGKRLSEYVAFATPFLVFIAVVGLLRLALSLAGLDNSVVKWISVTVAIWIGVIYYSVKVYTSGFGGYKQLLPVVVLLTAVGVVVYREALSYYEIAGLAMAIGALILLVRFA